MFYTRLPIRVIPFGIIQNMKWLIIYSLLIWCPLVFEANVGAEEPSDRVDAWLDSMEEDDLGLSPEEEFLFMDESMVVSAAKYRQPLSQAPSTIYVITDEDIRQSGLTDIGELLRIVPGLDVMALSAGQVEVSARGFNQALSNKMLVMIDDRSVFVTSYNFVAWNSLPIVIDEIQRIEVILGPGSVLYGANAFSGVIHIITKDPKEIKGTHLMSTVGNRNAFHHALSHGGAWKRWGWKVVAGWDEEDRWTDITPDEWLTVFGTEGRRPPGDAGDTWRANATIEYRPADETLWRLYGATSQGDTELLAQSESGFVKMNNDTFYTSMSFEHRALKLMTYYESGNSNWNPVQNSLPTASMSYQVADISGQYSFDPTGWCKLTCGGNFRYNYIRWPSYLENSYRIQDASGFLQGVLVPIEDVALTIGGRYDRYEIVGEHISYRGSLVYTGWKNNTLRFTVGNAFRNPSYIESYMHVVTPIFQNYDLSVVGNKDLDPEGIRTCEVAHLGAFFNRRLATRTILFFNEYQDFINSRILEFWPSLLMMPRKVGFVNIGKAQAFGGEVAVDMEVVKGLDLFINYSFQHLEFTSDDPFTFANEKGKQVPSTPTHKINAGGRYSLDNGFSFNLQTHYISSIDWEIGSTEVIEQQFGGYFLVNARVAYSCYDGRLEYALTGTNLLFDKHREYPLGDLIGTQFFISFRLSFGEQ